MVGKYKNLLIDPPDSGGAFRGGPSDLKWLKDGKKEAAELRKLMQQLQEKEPQKHGTENQSSD